MHYVRHLMGCLFVLGLLTSCGYLLDDNEDDDTPTVAVPQVTTLTANPTTISSPGESVVLSWTVSGTDPSLSLSPEPGPVTGTSISVTPDATTTYTLTATNAQGTSNQDVTVTLDETAPPEEPTPPDEDPEDPRPPDEEPLDVTGSWRWNSQEVFFVGVEQNVCPLIWAVELGQSDEGVNGWYGLTEATAPDDLESYEQLACFDTARLAGTIDAEGNVVLKGEFIYADFTEATGDEPPYLYYDVSFKLQVVDEDTLSGSIDRIEKETRTISTYANVTLERVDTSPDAEPESASP